jgi:phosphopantothenate synthetase
MKVTASYSVLHTAPLTVDLFISNAQSRAERIKQKLRKATEYSVLHLGTADLVAILRGIPNWAGFKGALEFILFYHCCTE